MRVNHMAKSRFSVEGATLGCEYWEVHWFPKDHQCSNLPHPHFAFVPNSFSPLIRSHVDTLFAWKILISVRVTILSYSLTFVSGDSAQWVNYSSQHKCVATLCAGLDPLWPQLTFLGSLLVISELVGSGTLNLTLGQVVSSVIYEATWLNMSTVR